MKNFIQSALIGEVMTDEIDDFVSRWHESNSDVDLPAYLGMTSEEYALWVSDPSLIGLILAARHERRPIVEAVNDNFDEINALAARSDDTAKITQLKAWLKGQIKRDI